CYPSPVDGCDYINVAASLPPSSPLREEGWPDHVAVVHPVDDAGHARMLEQSYGNPFLHHVTFGIPLPELSQEEGLPLAAKLVGRMVEIREKIASVFEEQPGTLVIALPKKVRRDP